jgi:hypothetical protein
MITPQSVVRPGRWIVGWVSASGWGSGSVCLWVEIEQVRPSGASDEDCLAIGGPGARGCRFLDPHNGMWPPGGQVPDPHRGVSAAGGEPGAIRRDRHRPHPAGVAGEGTAQRWVGQIRQRPAVSQSGRGVVTGEGGDLGSPVCVVGDAAVEDVDPAVGGFGGDQQVRGLPEQPAQPDTPWRVDQGQVGVGRGGAGLVQPCGDPAQVSGQGLGVTGPLGGEEILDQASLRKIPLLRSNRPPACAPLSCTAPCSLTYPAWNPSLRVRARCCLLSSSGPRRRRDLQ